MNSLGSTPSGLWTAVGALAVFSVAWMLSLVPFARAVLGLSRRARAGLRLRSATHGLAWCGVAVSIGWLMFSGGTNRTNNILVGGIFLVGIPAAEAGLLWFGRALQRNQDRAAVMPAPSVPVAPPPTFKRARHAEPAPAARPRTASAGSWLGWLPMLVAVLLLGWFAQHNRFIQALSLSVHRHEALLLWIVVPLTVVGFAAFMFGCVEFIFVAGHPMSREEVESQISTSRLIGVAYWQGGFKYRVHGDAVGLQAEQTLSLVEIKQAWKGGAGKSSPRWRAIFLLLGGGVVTVFAGLSIALASGPAFMQLIVAAAVIYAAIRLALAWARA
jgi:hypothetical protein